MTADQVRQAMAEYKEKHSISQNQLAKLMGYENASVLSRFNNGTYDNDNTVIEKWELFARRDEQVRGRIKKQAFSKISTSQQVIDLLDLCHGGGEFGVVYGDPGVGKTMAIQQYAKENKDAIVITIRPTNASVAGINEMIAEKLGIKETVSRRITEAVITKLKGTKRVIVIDEAQHLKAKVVNHLRSIVDATEDEETGERIGICLVGNDEIFHELRIKAKANYSQVADRITYWQHLVAKEVKKEDIALMFGSELTEDVLDMLYKVSTQNSVRKMVMLVQKTTSAFNIDLKELTASRLAAVCKNMKVRVA